MWGALARLLPAIASRVSAIRLTPALIESLSTRLSLAKSAVTIKNLVRLAKSNPLTAAMILYEAYGLSDELYQQIVGEHKEVGDLLGKLGLETDVDTPKTNLDDSADELELISSAIAVAGSYERLLVLRKALTLSDVTYREYVKIRTVGKRLR